MNRTRAFPILKPLAASALLLAMLAPAARATDTVLIWDSNGAAANVGGTGTWDTTSSLWRLTNTTGALQTYTNTTPSVILADFQGTAGTVTLASSTTINANSISLDVPGYTINGASGSKIVLTIGAGANNPATLTSTGGTSTINAVLDGTVNVAKGGTGTLVLGGANTYTGTTTINGGVLSISSIGTNGSTSSNLGTGSATSQINFGSSGNTGTLVYTGSGETTSRIVNVAGGSAVIENDGGNALNFSSNMTATVSGGARSLTLQGTNGGSFDGKIGTGSAATMALVKAGTGTWALSNTNTYNGGTTVTGGTLVISNGSGTASTTAANNSNGSATGTGALTVNANTTLAGKGTSAGSSFSISGTGTTTLTRANVLVGQPAGGDTNTTGAMTLLGGTAAGNSTIANANLTFNLDSSSVGSGNELNVGATGILFGPGARSVTLTLNLQNTGIIPANSAYVLIAGTGTTTMSSTSTPATTSGQFGGLTTFVNSAGLNQIVNSGNGGTGNLVLALSGVAQTFYGSNSYLFIRNTGGVDDIEVEVVPEPSTWALILGGLASLVYLQSRRRKQS